MQISLGPADTDSADLYRLSRQLLIVAAFYALADVALMVLIAGLKGFGWTMSLLLSTCVAAALAWLFSQLRPADPQTAVFFWWAVLLVWVLGQAVAIGAVCGWKSRTFRRAIAYEDGGRSSTAVAPSA